MLSHDRPADSESEVTREFFVAATHEQEAMSPDIGRSFAHSRMHNGSKKRIRTGTRSRSRWGRDKVDIHRILFRPHGGLEDVVVKGEVVVLQAPKVM